MDISDEIAEFEEMSAHGKLLGTELHVGTEDFGCGFFTRLLHQESHMEIHCMSYMMLMFIHDSLVPELEHVPMQEYLYSH